MTRQADVVQSLVDVATTLVDDYNVVGVAPVCGPGADALAVPARAPHVGGGRP